MTHLNNTLNDILNNELIVHMERDVTEEMWWKKDDAPKHIFLLEFLCYYNLGVTQQKCYYSENLLLCELWNRWIIHIDFTKRGLPWKNIIAMVQ